LAALKTLFPPDAVFVSDAPWSVAWYGERKAVWAPTGVKDMALIETQVTPIAGLVLTPGAQSLTSKEDDESINWTRFTGSPGSGPGTAPGGGCPTERWSSSGSSGIPPGARHPHSAHAASADKGQRLG